MMHKHLPVIISMILFVPVAGAQNWDQFDVDNYQLLLEIDQPGETISGHTTVHFTSLDANLDQVDLMLLGFTIDSITQQGQHLTHQYDDTLINIDLPSAMGVGATDSITIYYHGTPAVDPSGWGGFYFTGNYAFNMGVGFESDPHNFGRAWYPCVDNFVDRATYRFNIFTQPGYKAFCNGLLTDTAHMNNKIRWQWTMQQPVPSYLVSVAVADYATVELNHQGLLGDIPVTYGVRADDSIKMKSSFRHIHDGISSFENNYGPHRFDRIGFVVVPFTGGAMEHATNIAYPRFAIGGGLRYETLWAHELAHHWWGDLVTCRTAEDMWINEGLASFSEFIFTENVYGKQAYHDAVRKNHFDVLYEAHIRDGKPYPLYPLPHEVTYGAHAYNKGADVAHTLRSYLGDSLFFSSIRRFMTANAFHTVTSETLRDSLSKYAGINLDPFFSSWVFNPGFPHFDITRRQVLPEGNVFDVELDISQKLRFTSEMYGQVPLEVWIMDDQWQLEKHLVKVGGAKTTVSFQTGIQPEYIGLDLDGLISDAKTGVYKTINIPGNYDFGEALMEVDVTGIDDSAFIHVIHHWVGADYFNDQNPGIRLSGYRYWSVEGLFPDTFSATATINYDATQNLDHTLNINNEDSLVLLYKASPESEWQVYADYTKNILINNTDGRGRIVINNLKRGYYVFGMLNHESTGLEAEDDGRGHLFKIYPNPAREQLRMEWPGDLKVSKIEVFSATGSQIHLVDRGLKQGNIRIDINNWKQGTYFVRVVLGNQTTIDKSFVLVD